MRISQENDMKKRVTERAQLPKDIDQGNDPAHKPDDSSVGLTDDERVSREKDTNGVGARVEPGPADAQRLLKP